MKKKIPKEILDIIDKLETEGFKAYPVGGCVRDSILGKEPKDWDVATEAKPEDMQSIFPESVYENEFGTVAVKTDSDKDHLKVIEVTTFRLEKGYSDNRRPDEIVFAKTIEEDISRRDFTVNAMAFDAENSTLIDPYNGQGDIEGKIIRTVGNPNERLNEDALRLVRAVRFAVQLGFEIEEKTKKAIKDNSKFLQDIAQERIRDEFVKIVMSDEAERGIRLLEEFGLMEYIIPELREGIDCDQAKHHIYTVWEHNIRSLGYAAEKDYSLVVRLAALLHDVGKPRTKKGKGENTTFHNHEVVGGKMTRDILNRLRFSKDLVKKISHLVRQHLFYYDIGEVTESGIRRFVKRVGKENIDDLIKVREADRIGSGVPKAVPYRLRHMLFMIEKVSKDPISIGMLAVDGNDIMKDLGIQPGPRLGLILKALLEDVLEDPELNNKEYLLNRAKEINELKDDKLRELANAGQEKLKDLRREEERKMKRKYRVK